ncbi:MAG: preprotein translocase subunit SecA [Endomicrobium sp.]|jgi:preprotein translocase subunit SecA|nr:preprotein translocase subunit SecA [Endomicrobium sp.]
MLRNIFNYIFGSQNKRDINAIKPIIEKVNSFEIGMKKISDNDLKLKTFEFKKRLLNGETLDDILPEAFACVREASSRTIKLRHFDVQIIGGYVLHNGKIAEMKTGEGKTLVATLPAYLNALTEKGVHIVTVNDYLAKRDKEWMGAVYEKLGLTVGNVIHSTTNIDRKKAYNCDITYVTNNELGFDYLRDNMIVAKEDRILRQLNYAIIDEVDSILIDEARTPLIISGATEQSTDKYYASNKIISSFIGRKITENEEIKAKYKGIDLTKGYDYIVDEKNHSVVLTEQGMQKAEKILGVKNIYNDLQSEWVHHITQAIKAHNLYRRDVEYVVKNGEIIIVDEFTGRLMPGRRWSDGLHQAIEAKENLEIAEENQTLATITFQNFFRMYKKISGMTGTALTESAEFWEIYKLGVVEIPTKNPIIRIDYPDVIYRTEKEKYDAIITEIESLWKKTQPILVGTRSIEKSEKISTMLKKKGIPHKILNAKYHELEAQIIAGAGMKNAVTIATNMAGRGTDIVLGRNDLSQNEDVKKVGGLHIIGTERHESRRIDNQLRGRAGRQGDPGSSRFFLSMEDELMRLFGSDRMSAIMLKLGLKDGEDLQHPWISKAIENAQRKVEFMNFDIRKQLIDFDNVVNKQREAIYNLRNEIIDNDDITILIKDIINELINEKLSSLTTRRYLKKDDLPNINTWFFKTFGVEYKVFNINETKLNKDTIRSDIFKKVIEIYHVKQKHFSFETMLTIQKIIFLQVIDLSWKDHLYELDQLKHCIGYRSYAQKDPKIEYQRDSFILFESMMKKIRKNTIEHIFRTHIDNGKNEILESYNLKPNEINFDLKNNTHKQDALNRNLRKIKRNDKCICGSGKKYKKCCGMS